MKILKGKSIIFPALAAVCLAFAPGISGASNSNAQLAKTRLTAIKECRLASLRCEVLKTSNRLPKDLQPGPAATWLKPVSAEEVNMVTNRHEQKKQDGITINGKTYYGTGEGYALTLSKNLSLRYAADPLTEKKIDKSDAVIYADASGRVHYFESEETFRGFIALEGLEGVSSKR